MQCPVCKKLMIDVEYQRIALDYCPKCRGVWFDSGELELLIDCAGLSECNLVDIVPKETEVREAKRGCPICGRTMFKGAIGQEPKLIIDVCRRGDGLWFDGGELSALFKQMAGEGGAQGAQQKLLGFLGEVFKAGG
jgi:Zn-finger nucleic acid-binding protein